LLRRLAVDADEDVRRGVLRQLENLAGECDLTTRLPILRAALRRGGMEAVDVCRVLGLVGPPARSAVPDLLGALRAGDGSLAIAATEALWKVDRRIDEALPILAKLGTAYGEGVCDTIYVIGPSAAPLVDYVIRCLEDDYWDLQWAAADALGALACDDPKVLSALETALGHPSGLVASAAARAFAGIGEAALPLLMRLLADHGDPRCEWAADAVGRMGVAGRAAAAQLKTNLICGQPRIVAWSAIALAQVAGDPAAVPMLLELLARQDRPDLRQGAARALQAIGPAAHTAEAALAAALNDEDPTVREDAEKALAAIRSRPN
jgi:hypothetical protein